MKQYLFLSFFFAFALSALGQNTTKSTENDVKPVELLESQPDLAGFLHRLATLDKRELKSMTSAREYLELHVPAMTSFTDSICLAYADFANEMLLDYNDRFYDAEPELISKLEQGTDDTETRQFTEMLANNGLQLSQSEGYFYIEVQPDYFWKLFRSRVSPALRDFLEIRKLEMGEGFSEDAELEISFEQLSQRIVVWEDYLGKYPQSPVIADADYYYHMYLQTFLTGTDNSPVYDYETETMLPEMRQLYRDYIAKHPGRKSTQIITDYFHVVQANNFAYSDGIEKFLEQHGLSSMLDVQPDLR